MSIDAMTEIRASFFVECEELMESLHDALAILDAGDGTDETVNVVFRAVHSIKGGAGAFGLDALVGFAHRLETVLDELRAGRLDPTPGAVRLFFQAADMLHDHIRAAQSQDAPPPTGEDVLRALEGLMQAAPQAEPEAVDFTPTGLSFDPMLPQWTTPPGTSEWTIRFRPHAGLYRSGNEALLILRALAGLGDTHTTCIVPPALALDPATAEQPQLGWIITLTGDVSEADIREIFDFVTDVCDLDISPADDAADGSATDGVAAAMASPDAIPFRLAPDSIVAAANHDDPPATSPGVGEAGLAPELQPPPAPSNAAAPAPAQPASPKAEPDAAAATIRVDLDRVDRLVNLVGELVINQAMLAQSVTEAGMAENTAVMNGLEEFMMLTRDIQDGVMMIRAQPVKPLFQRMARIVREASTGVAKQVRLRTEGDQTEVDKTVIERLSDPLTHMIRNSVDHGIETPARRLAAGKPAEGVITLSASHRAGRVLIEICDDGAGIDRARVRDIAVARGLIAADAQLTEAEVDNLLFLPGFSTASQVSALSGRGVGMDVVKRAITALGGRVAIASEPGVGTKFSISLPLTLAVLDGMVVRVADQTLVVPLSSIVETATLTPQAIRRIGRSAEVLHIRGDLVPLFDLGARLGFRQARAAGDRVVILTTQEDGGRAALIVDAIMEQRQVVIKGLSRNYGRVPGVAAATILGDGKVALILDPSDLTRSSPQTAIDAIPLAG
ncbi:chemotaxis protein CheA [Paracoccus luteus]|uniref:chemotaxis protein CheA n=1 Tax=Paracoccus luteus TaxID=2508543 RepID=UPI00106F9C8C|nr:chemotaxis protein CheA [Paracoccus luteus]